MEIWSENSEKRSILDAYYQYFNSYTQRNWKGMTEMFASKMSFIGTGIDETSSDKSSTLELYKRDFDQCPNPIKYRIKKIDIEIPCRNLAYLIILADLKFIMQNEEIEYKDNRSSIVMIKENKQWKLTQGHWSQPSEIQDIGESIPYKKLKERNRELENKIKERTLEIEQQNNELKLLNQNKTNILSIISHDLRSPFNVMVGMTELMITDFDSKIKNPDYFKERLSYIHEKSRTLYDVADNLLKWAWTHTSEITIQNQSFLVKGFVAEQIKPYNDLINQKEIRISFTIPENLLLTSDKEIIGILIRNLVSNAIKYSYRDNTINITVEKFDRSAIFSVSDEGTGFLQNHPDAILKSDMINSMPGTEKEKGTGLGLLICKNLVEKLNGTLTIQPNSPKGSIVSFQIPVGDATTSSKA